MDTSRGSRSRLLCVVIMLLSGCGLSDYEEKMVREQKKQDLIDEQDTYLGDAAEIVVASVPGSNQPPIDIFFRVPKRISPAPNAKWGEIYQRHDPLPRPRLRPGMVPPPETPFLDVYIAAAPPGELKEFADKAQQPFPKGAATELARVTKTFPGRPPMEFLTATFNDTAAAPTTFFLYLPQSPQARLAIVFHVYKDKATHADVTKAIDVCLQSLAIGNDAKVARQDYKPS